MNPSPPASSFYCKATRLCGYGKPSPGSTFDLCNEPAIITWLNQLPDKHPFSLDYGLHGAGQTTHEHEDKEMVKPYDTVEHARMKNT
jgi:hypothetical protein